MTRVAGRSPANGGERAARRAQAAASRAKTGDYITWKGEKFYLADGDLPGWAQLVLAHMSNQDMTTRDPEAEDGIWQILEAGLRGPSGIPPGQPGFDAEKWEPGEFRRFGRHAMKTRATLEDIMDAVKDLIEAYAARPTSPPPGSSPGPPPTTGNSTESSSPEEEQALPG